MPEAPAISRRLRSRLEAKLSHLAPLGTGHRVYIEKEQVISADERTVRGLLISTTPSEVSAVDQMQQAGGGAVGPNKVPSADWRVC
jgi:hypothetical protein